MEATKSIFFSKFKTTGLFYSYGQHIVTLYNDDTLTLSTFDSKIHKYLIESVYEHEDYLVLIILSVESGVIGELRLNTNRTGELSFSGEVVLKLK